jgi:hypothetical protein
MEVSAARTKTYEIPSYELNGKKYIDWEKLPGVEKSSSGRLIGRDTLSMLASLLER